MIKLRNQFFLEFFIDASPKKKTKKGKKMLIDNFVFKTKRIEKNAAEEKSTQNLRQLNNQVEDLLNRNRQKRSYPMNSERGDGILNSKEKNKNFGGEITTKKLISNLNNYQSYGGKDYLTRDKNLERRLETTYKDSSKFIKNTLKEQIKATRKQIPHDRERARVKENREREIQSREERWRRRNALETGVSRTKSDNDSSSSNDSEIEEEIGGINVFAEDVQAEQEVASSATLDMVSENQNIEKVTAGGPTIAKKRPKQLQKNL